MKRIPLKSGDELDAFSKYRKYHRWGRGAIKKIKKAYNKRFRKHNQRCIPHSDS